MTEELDPEIAALAKIWAIIKEHNLTETQWNAIAEYIAGRLAEQRK